MSDKYLSGVFDFGGEFPVDGEEVDFIDPETDPTHRVVIASLVPFDDAASEDYPIASVGDLYKANWAVDAHLDWYISRNGYEEAGLKFSGSVRIDDPAELLKQPEAESQAEEEPEPIIWHSNGQR